MSRKIVLFLAAAFAVMTSCVDDRGRVTGPVAGDERCTFVVKTPAARPVSRAIDEGGFYDNEVKEITVMLFSTEDGNSYIGSVAIPGEDISTPIDDPTQKRFMVDIAKGEYVALFIANADEYVAELDPTDMSIADVEAALVYTAGGKYVADPQSGEYKPFVMSSERVPLTIPSNRNYSVAPVDLLRNVAKINLEVGTDAMEITEVLLVNYNKASHVTPSGGHDSTRGEMLYDPAGEGLWGDDDIVTGVEDAISYIDEIVDGKLLVDEMFTPERGLGDDNLCLLVKANVTIDETEYDDRWYKLDFRGIAPNADEGALPVEVNILRNYSYTITVTGVGNTGWGSAEEACDNPAEGVTVDVTAIDDLNDVTYNGQYQIAVNSSIVEFSAAAGTQEIKVYTDYFGGWVVESVTTEGESWLSTPSEVTGQAGEITMLEIEVTENTAAEPRTGEILLKAGKLLKTIAVTQAGV